MTGYSKLFGSILASTVWLESPATKVVWITMLAMTDRDGVVEASVPGLAKFAGVTRAECETALDRFMAPDPDSRSPEHEGRRIEKTDGGWRLLNYEKYRQTRDAEEVREKTAERVRNFRNRNAVKRNVTPVTRSNDIASASADPSADPDPPIGPPLGDAPAAPAPKLKRVPRVGTGLPEDWQPTDVDRAFAAAKGWLSDKVASEAERFRAHHLAKSTVSKD